MGLGLMLQNALGLRPGELLRLTPADLRVSPEAGKRHVLIVRLGACVGTKSGREQFAMLDINKWPALWSRLSVAVNLTENHQRLFPYSLPSVYHWLRAAQRVLLLDLHITPHSPRVGFVSDELVEGTPPPVI